MDLKNVYDLLLHKLGTQNWWPASNEIEMLIGMILVQNTNWLNVEKSLANLEEATKFDLEKTIALNDEDLQSLIKPSGFYKSKASYIKNILDFYQNKYQEFNDYDTDDLRKKLLTIKGVGYETADVILLYLFHRPVFVSDAYAKKLFATLLGDDSQQISYMSLKKFVEDNAIFALNDYKEFHALIVEYGKTKSNFLAEYQLSKELRGKFLFYK